MFCSFEGKHEKRKRRKESILNSHGDIALHEYNNNTIDTRMIPSHTMNTDDMI